jgi:hypothetical protein
MANGNSDQRCPHCGADISSTHAPLTDKAYMDANLKAENDRSKVIARDRANIATHPEGTGKIYTAGSPDDEYSESVERSYEREHGPSPQHDAEPEAEYPENRQFQPLNRRRLSGSQRRGLAKKL